MNLYRHIYDSFTSVRRDRLDLSGITRILAIFNYDLQVYTGKYCTKVGNELRISKEYAEGMNESCTIKRKFVTVLDNA